MCTEIHRAFIYLDGRPLAVAQSDQANSGASPVEEGVYWVHTDHLGTPVLVTNSARTERWRWENDPFGRSQPIEYTVSASDVSPDDDSSSGTPAIYNTCCCTVCGVSGCGGGTSGCASNCCDGGDANGLVWSKTYAPGSANNVRVHFSQFDVKAGSTRTAKDYVQVTTGSDAVVATLTGALGEFWGPWTNDSSAKVKLYTDNVADGTRGVVVDKLEYTTATNGRFVMHLRFPGQVWDEEAQHAYNYQRWYRAEDGRYVSPDFGDAPIAATDFRFSGANSGQRRAESSVREGARVGGMGAGRPDPGRDLTCQINPRACEQDCFVVRDVEYAWDSFYARRFCRDPEGLRRKCQKPLYAEEQAAGVTVYQRCVEPSLPGPWTITRLPISRVQAVLAGPTHVECTYCNCPNGRIEEGRVRCDFSR